MSCWLSLRTFSLITASVHAILFVIFIGFSLSSLAPTRMVFISTKSMATFVPNTVNVNLDPYIVSQVKNTCPTLMHAQSHSSQNYTVPTVLASYEIDCRYLIIAFHGLSALFQFLDSYSKSSYDKVLEEGKTLLSHFIEYSISASLMLVAIAVQWGAVDITLISLIFVCCWACMVFGLLAEVLFENCTEEFHAWDTASIPWHWMAHIFGWITLLAAIMASMSSYLTFLDCSIISSQLPEWLKIATALVLGMFCCFGFVQFYTFYMKKRKTKENLDFKKNDPTPTLELSEQIKTHDPIKAHNERIARQVEFMYILLSLTAKSLLGIFIFASNYAIR